MKPNDLESLLGRVDVGLCWEWTGTKDRNGYGKVSFHGSMRAAHRIVWTLLVGPIPKGLTLDHLCRNHACVNPDHLEPVTIKENIRRGWKTRATHCPQGHEFTVSNTYVTSSGTKICRICRREIRRKYRAGH